MYFYFWMMVLISDGINKISGRAEPELPNKQHKVYKQKLTI